MNSPTSPHTAAAILLSLFVVLVPGAAAARQATDRRAPTAPTALVATGAVREVDLRWSASKDNVAVTGYRVYRGGTQIGQTSAGVLTYADLAVMPGTLYSYTVRATDAAGNVSVPSNGAQASALDTPLADTQAPTVQVTYPTAAATV